jgi:hypothetical protein
VPKNGIEQQADRRSVKRRLRRQPGQLRIGHVFGNQQSQDRQARDQIKAQPGALISE